MKILIATPEATPYAKTGGLADVTGALLKEYRKMGLDAYLMLPLYKAVRARFNPEDTGLRVSVPVGDVRHEGRIFSDGSSSFFVGCDEFFDRDDLYGTTEGDYPDNAYRFAFFERAVLESCRVLELKPDLIHCNDWQTGLIPLYLKTLYGSDFFARTGTVMTVHNLGYQGLFDPVDFRLTGLPRGWFNPEGVEFYGKMNFLKAGLIASDIITTVSDTYAREILTAEFGYGLEGVLRKRREDLYGVINGIDTHEWDPGRDGFIPAHFDSSDISGKAKCKKELMKECSLNKGDGKGPLAAFIGRLSEQKGLDILIEAVDDIISMGVKLVILGRGEEDIQRKIAAAAERHKGRIFVKVGFDEAFSRRIYAGSDIFLMPSRYEPCGLGQLIAMRYGTIPVARKTGGLADTVTDYEPLKGHGAGFLFRDYDASSLAECLGRALCLYADRKRWEKTITEAMGKDFSWKNSAAKYIELYGRAIEKRNSPAAKTRRHEEGV